MSRQQGSYTVEWESKRFVGGILSIFVIGFIVWTLTWQKDNLWIQIDYFLIGINILNAFYGIYSSIYYTSHAKGSEESK